MVEEKEEVREQLGTDLQDLFDPAYALRNLGTVFERVEELKGRLEGA
jgi:adenylosuccinate lyase